MDEAHAVYIVLAWDCGQPSQLGMNDTEMRENGLPDLPRSRVVKHQSPLSSPRFRDAPDPAQDPARESALIPPAGGCVTDACLGTLGGGEDRNMCSHLLQLPWNDGGPVEKESISALGSPDT